MDKIAANFIEGLKGIGNILGNTYNSTKKLVVSEPFRRGLGLAAGFSVVSIAAGAINKIVSEQYHIYKSQEYFEAMLKEHPQLKQFKPADVAKYFNSLNHFAPSMAKDPLAAGAYITQSLKKLSDEELGGPPPDTFSTLTDIEKKMTDSKNVKSKGQELYTKLTENAISLGFNKDYNTIIS